MRKTLTLLCLLAGIGLASVSFFMAIPGDPFGSTPKIPFASVFFIVGIMVAFLSAVVYELTPVKRTPHRSSAYKARIIHH